MRTKKERPARVVFTEPVNDRNAARLRRLGFDAAGAVYHNVSHRQEPPMQNGDYALVELANGIVLAALVTRLGQQWTPLSEVES